MSTSPAMSDHKTSLREKFPVSLFNSLSKKKEVFTSVHPGMVGMYLCGPTVYGDPHMGHARSAITFDVIFRYFSFLGYKVRYVRNITDVGHLEDEVAEGGEDKIAKKARLEKLEPMEIVQTYTVSYRQSMYRLNCLPPSIESTATGHIIEQIETIKQILENGWAYEVNGSIYFDLSAYAKENDYGQLSGKVLDELISGSRDLDKQDEKKHPFDFALWKKAKPEHIMRWPSPWGIGFPGWHIECTSMSTKYLGTPFDIHGGGMDLQFPHHEAEIAQSVASCGKVPANYWMHNNMLTLEKAKMSKSAGNFITLDELFAGKHALLEQAYSPMTFRFFILQSYYRSLVDFSNKALQAAEKGYRGLMQSIGYLNSLEHVQGNIDQALNKEIIQLTDECYLRLSDDFNTARALAALFDLSSKINAFYHQQLPLSKLSTETFNYMSSSFIGLITEVLGLIPEDDQQSDRLASVLDLLIDIRHEARNNKDYATSDKIRDQLQKLGIQLKDEKGGGTTFVFD